MAMDISALSAAFIGVIGGAAATGVGSYLRLRTTERTAVRLIFAELARGSAAVAYFRSSGSWSEVPMMRAAWDKYSETLARARRPETFELAQKGYAAFDSVAYIAANPAMDKEMSKRLVDENIGWLVEALKSLAERANAPAVEEAVRRLTVPVEVRGSPSIVVGAAPPSLLSQVFDMQVAVGDTPGAALDEVLRAEEPRDVRPPSRREQAGAPGPGTPTDAPDIRIYDAQGQSGTLSPDLPLVRTTQSAPSPDQTVEDVYDGIMTTWRFFREVFSRDSVDGRGGPINAVVHYGKDYANAFWDGKRLVVGDGDGVIFSPFSQHLDVLANQLSRGITNQAGLAYKGESGSITESFSDAIGILVKQWAGNQTVDESSWLIADGLILPSKAGQGLRSMKAPGTAYDTVTLGRDPQPDHMSGFVKTENDNGGAHINSGIPNRAFYLAAQALGGYAWEVAGMVWYRTMVSDVLTPSSRFTAFAGATVALADRDYEDRPEVSTAIATAWRDVGITPRRTKRVDSLLARAPTGT